MMPRRTSRLTKASTFSKSGYSQAEPFNQKDPPVAPSKVISLRSRRFPGGISGMKTPNAKRMPSHSPSAGHSAIVAFVSGPRSVRNVWSRLGQAKLKADPARDDLAASKTALRRHLLELFTSVRTLHEEEPEYPSGYQSLQRR